MILGEPYRHVNRKEHDYCGHGQAAKLDPTAPGSSRRYRSPFLEVRRQPAAETTLLAASPFWRARRAASSTCGVDSLPNFGEKSVGFESACCKRIKMQSLLINRDLFLEADLCDGNERFSGIPHQLHFDADKRVTGHCSGEAILARGTILRETGRLHIRDETNPHVALTVVDPVRYVGIIDVLEIVEPVEAEHPAAGREVHNELPQTIAARSTQEVETLADRALQADFTGRRRNAHRHARRIGHPVGQPEGSSFLHQSHAHAQENCPRKLFGGTGIARIRHLQGSNGAAKYSAVGVKSASVADDAAGEGEKTCRDAHNKTGRLGSRP